MKDKELIILTVYMNIENLSPQQVDQNLLEFMKLMNEIFEDEELKERYIIKKIIVPSNETKIECTYPSSKTLSKSVDLEHQIKKVETEILKYKDSKLWDEWNTLMRWAKLKNLKDE